MKFRTEIDPLKMAGFLTHGAPVVMLGSCFSDEISRKMRADGFNVTSNPFGPIYSPAALNRMFCWLYDETIPTDIFFHDGLWRSFLTHTKLAFPIRDELEKELNNRRRSLKNDISEAQCVILTLGSARSYFYNEEPVINCHKLPAKEFKLCLSTPEDVAENLNTIVGLINQVNPHCKIILTVSPIRHGGFGLHGNEISKAVLILGIEDFMSSHPESVYFPSYEILLDDLRDYRYYADDMKHPSSVAINYIYEKFTNSFYDEHTLTVAKEFHNLFLKINHRTIGNDGDANAAHERMIANEIDRIYSMFPELNRQNINILRQNLCTQ